MSDRALLQGIVVFGLVTILTVLASIAIGDFLSRVEEANAIQRAEQ